VSDTPHLREKTSKIGLMGRAAAIFKVDEIIIFVDSPKANQTRDANLVATLLRYMETPQYLRKRLFKIKPELQYAGILPPLRTQHHPLNRKMKNLKIGEYREGVTVSKAREGTFVDIGVEKPALILNKQLPIEKRITVKIAKIERFVEAEIVNRNEISAYWGYKVVVDKSFVKKNLKQDFDLTIATSKYGAPFGEVKEKITERWKNADSILVMFGAPAKGLYDIFKNQNINLDDATNFVVNAISKQGTETVRTEEALIASLAIFNEYFGL